MAKVAQAQDQLNSNHVPLSTPEDFQVMKSQRIVLFLLLKKKKKRIVLFLLTSKNIYKILLKASCSRSECTSTFGHQGQKWTFIKFPMLRGKKITQLAYLVQINITLLVTKFRIPSQDGLAPRLMVRNECFVLWFFLLKKDLRYAFYA